MLTFQLANGASASLIGQGCMGLGGELHEDRSNDASHLRGLRFGLECGLNFFDTAEAYAAGHSEDLVGQLSRDFRTEMFIATKFSPQNHRYADVLKAAEASLRRLQTDYIDLYQIHWPNPSIPIEETLEALVKLREVGKIRYIGVSNFSAKEMVRSHEILGSVPLSSNQCEFNLFDRFAEREIIPACKRYGVNFIAYSPLDKGRGSDSIDGVRLLAEISREYGKTPAQIILNWMVYAKGVYAIPKSINLQHIKENSDALGFALSDFHSKKIDMFFKGEATFIDPSSIEVSLVGEGNRKVYTNIRDALENKLGFSPSPSELASDLISGEAIKPVRVRIASGSSGRQSYELIEGRIRYWAWVIAFGTEQPIPVYIRSTV